MASKLFINVNVFDGLNQKLYPAEVRLSGNRIEAVAKGKNQMPRDGVEVIDGDGATLMPGLINTHSHITYNNGTDLVQLACKPPEETVLIAVRNAKLMLDHGFTALVGAASAKPRTEIVIRNEINAGNIPGPRLLACTPEYTVTGGLADDNKWEYKQPSVSIICDGPLEFCKSVRAMIREGVDMVKFNNSGDSFGFPRAATAEQNPMTLEEVRAICDTAKGMGRRLSAHAHADQSVVQCIEQGVEFIYHATFSSDATIEKLLKAKPRHWVVPAIAARYNTTHEAGDWGITTEVATAIGNKRELDEGVKTMTRMHQAGVKVLPFGDYGFAWLPHGTDTRDFEHFVNLMGFAPWEVLRAATAYGGEAWAGDTGEKLGQVKKDHLADLIMIDGDPLKDITLFQDTDNIVMVMKDGQFHKPPRSRRRQERKKFA